MVAGCPLGGRSEVSARRSVWGGCGSAPRVVLGRLSDQGALPPATPSRGQPSPYDRPPGRGSPTTPPKTQAVISSGVAILCLRAAGPRRDRRGNRRPSGALCSGGQGAVMVARTADCFALKAAPENDVKSSVATRCLRWCRWKLNGSHPLSADRPTGEAHPNAQRGLRPRTPVPDGLGRRRGSVVVAALRALCVLGQAPRSSVAGGDGCPAWLRLAGAVSPGRRVVRWGWVDSRRSSRARRRACAALG